MCEERVPFDISQGFYENDNSGAWGNSRHFVTPPLVSCKMTSEKRAQKFDTKVQIGVVLLIPMQHDQSEALPRSGSDMHQFGIPALVY